MTTHYQVSLSVFEGPLDLLLQLIEREKLDISMVSLAQVADQFLAHIRGLETIRPEALADFLVIAARLVWIKSRALLPQAAGASAEDELEGDPGEALLRQLREYKRFKAAAGALHDLEEIGQHTYVRVAPLPELERRLSGGGATLADLLAAAKSALAGLPAEPVSNGFVVPFTLTIGDQIRLIGRATSGGRTITFRSLLVTARHRLEIIVTLLAILELIKCRKIDVSQQELFGEILISPVPGAEITGTEEIEDAEN